MQIGIVESDNPKAKELGGKVREYLQSKGQEVVEAGGAQIIFTLGGDGTLIHTACKYAEKQVPIMGINMGKLGFLTACEADKWQEACDAAIDGKMVVSVRMSVDAEVGEKTYRAVNEIVLKEMYRVMEIEVKVNGLKFLEVSGDGILVGTQTGSTAYSLSAGGPIVDPKVDCFLLTPLNAHSLPIPSFVLSPDDKVELLAKKGNDVALVIDGQEHTKVKEGDVVVLKKGQFPIKLGYLEEEHFVNALNAKFGLAKRFEQ